MKEEIISNLNNPRQLEKLFRDNKLSFKKEFNLIYPDIQENTAAKIWHERLNYEKDEISWGSGTEIFFVLIASVIAGVVAKLPSLLNLNEYFFYPRNVGFIVFPLLTAYFAWKSKLSTGKIAFMSAVTLAGLIFINMLPLANQPLMKKSDTLMLSCMHLLLFLWSILGFAFVGGTVNNNERRLGFLKYNGDLIVMTTLIVIAGGILSGITIGLFSLIGFQIENFYFNNIGILGLAAAPVVGTYLTQTNPQLVGKVSPVIARIFSPLVLVMLVFYLVAIIYSGKDPYNDREFLLIFNALLIGVMAIVFFSVAETAKSEKHPAETWVLFLLTVVTLIVNGIALSAILFRISTWGVTPNRVAVFGSNVLILINLLMVASQLYKVITRKADLDGVGRSISFFLPVYSIWVTLVTFLFPLLFGFK